MNKRSIRIITLCIIACLLCDSFQAFSLGTENECVTRFDCLNRIMLFLGFDEIDAEYQTYINYYDGFKLVDIRTWDQTDSYIAIAYQCKVTYGELLSRGAERRLYDPNWKESLVWKNITLSATVGRGGYWIKKNGKWRYISYLFEAQSKCDLHFFRERAVTVNECIGFMARCVKADKTFINLDNTWAYAKQIGLILESDSFGQTPDAQLTQEDFDILFERFSNLTFERDWTEYTNLKWLDRAMFPPWEDKNECYKTISK